MPKAKTKDLTKYISTEEAATQLEEIAAELRQRRGLVRFYLNFWFHGEAQKTAFAGIEVLTRTMESRNAAQ